MTQRFEFVTATRIIFGPGVIREVGTVAKELGRRALVVTGRDASRADTLLQLLRAEGLSAITYSVAHEPDLETIQQGVAKTRAENCDLIISLGGGSVLDAGKAIAIMATNPGELLDYLEIIGRGRMFASPSLPFIAIPTTAGTGSEVTRNAVLGVPAQRAKVSLRSPLMLPRVALVDPELTLDLPPAITANTGLDALTQLIEPYVCSRANPMTDAFCVEGIRLAAKSLREVYENGRNTSARADIALASVLGGLALSNAGLGAVHGLAGPMGGMFLAPHGALCAALLPHVMAVNLHALQQRQPASESLTRYETVARLLTGNSTARAGDGVAWIAKLVADLQIPPLRTYGVKIQDAPEIITRGENSSSIKANPISLTAEELTFVIASSL